MLGFTLVFVLLGTSVSFFGGFFEEHRATMYKVAGGAMISFGLLLTGLPRVAWLQREWRPNLSQDMFGAAALTASRAHHRLPAPEGRSCSATRDRKTLRRFPHLDKSDRESIDALTGAIVRKTLHSPLTRLKLHSGGQAYLAVTRDLFGLDQQSAAGRERERAA